MTVEQEKFVVNTLERMIESDAAVEEAINAKTYEAISSLGYKNGYTVESNAFNIGNTVHICITDMTISKTAIKRVLEGIDATVHVGYDENAANEAVKSKEPYAQQLFDKITNYKADTGYVIAEINESELILSNCGNGFYGLSIQGENIQSKKIGGMFTPHAIATALVFFKADRTLF